MSTDAPTSDLRAQLQHDARAGLLTRALLTLRRIASTALRSMARNGLLTITTVLIMTVMLGGILLVRTATALGSHAREEIAKRITISLEVRDTASPANVEALRQELAQFPHVTDVDYVTKDEARQELEALGLEVPDFIGDNPFADRLRVQTDELQTREQVLNYITTSRFKDDVLITERENAGSTYEQKVRAIDQVIGSAQRVGIGLATLFALIAALVIVTTVRLTIHTRRDELAIMQLVGASRSSIVGPFVLEAILDAVIAAALAVALFGPFIERLFPGFDRFFEGFGIQQYLATALGSLVLLLLVVGAGLGALASLVSTWWYLRKQPVL